MTKTRIERFLEKVQIDPISGCWLWIGHVNKVSGYGQFWDGEKVVGAHVFSYVHHKGPLPEGFFVAIPSPRAMPPKRIAIAVTN